MSVISAYVISVCTGLVLCIGSVVLSFFGHGNSLIRSTTENRGIWKVCPKNGDPCHSYTDADWELVDASCKWQVMLARSILLTTNGVGVCLVAAFVLCLYCKHKAVVVATIVCTALYVVLLLVTCALLTSVYQKTKDSQYPRNSDSPTEFTTGPEPSLSVQWVKGVEGTDSAPGWSLMFPWFGWVGAMVLLPVDAAIIILISNRPEYSYLLTK